VTSFRLKRGIVFTPQDDRFVVVDEATHSTFRVGHTEYLILRSLNEKTDVEEVAYSLRAESGISIPYDKLNQFVQRGIRLNIIEVVDGSLVKSGAFAIKTKIFDPSSVLERILAVWRRSKLHLLILGGGLFAAALVVNIVHFRELWVVRSLKIPPYGPMVVLLIYASCLGHEMMHGLVAKSLGFDVPEVGFHFHYCVPSFYCKILTPTNPNRKKVGLVLLAGSVFDLGIITALVLIWVVLPARSSFKEIIAYAVSLIWLKILFIQLNPLFPLSDGYRMTGLLLRKRGQ
jgi:hypothetical protein